MGVVSVDEIRGPRTGTQGRDWTRTYTRAFRVITDDPNIGPRTVAMAVGLQIGDHYQNSDGSEHDNGSYVMDIAVAEEGEDGKSWIVTYSYGPYDPAQWPENPLTKPPDVQWGFSPMTKVASEDINGSAVVNSANDYFDPPIEIEDPRVTLSFVRNEPVFNPARAYAYRNAINTDSFLGCDPLTVKVTQISGVRQWDQYLSSINYGGASGFYWTVTYEFEFNPDKWTFKILDQGMRKIDTATGQQAQILESGIPISSPKLLDGNGQPIEPGDDPVFLEFHLFPEKEFGGLMIEYPGP
jgi:hypothetical protein